MQVPPEAQIHHARALLAARCGQCPRSFSALEGIRHDWRHQSPILGQQATACGDPHIMAAAGEYTLKGLPRCFNDGAPVVCRSRLNSCSCDRPSTERAEWFRECVRKRKNVSTIAGLTTATRLRGCCHVRLCPCSSDCLHGHCFEFVASCWVDYTVRHPSRLCNQGEKTSTLIRFSVRYKQHLHSRFDSITKASQLDQVAVDHITGCVVTVDYTSIG